MTDGLGGRHDEVRGVTIELSEPFAQSVGPRGVSNYVALLGSIVATEDDLDDDAIETALRTGLADWGIDLPESSIVRTIEQLAQGRAGGLSILDDSGTVLYVSPADTPAAHEPVVAGTDDPVHPHRPLDS